MCQNIPVVLMILILIKSSNFDGYSNHCPEIIAPLTAVNFGAQIIEVHITDDKSKDYFDNNVSFGYKELDELIKLIRHRENN